MNRNSQPLANDIVLDWALSQKPTPQGSDAA